MVLGVQWLKSLGPDLTDYNDLTFKFFHHGKIIELKGHSDSDLHTVTPNQLRRITQTDSASVFLHIRVLHLASTTPATSQYLEIATIYITKIIKRIISINIHIHAHTQLYICMHFFLSVKIKDNIKNL